MTLARGKLADIQQLPATTPAALLTNASGKKTYVKGFTLFNGNTTVEVVKLHNVPDSSGSVGAAALGNQFMQYSMAALETLHFPFDYPLVLTDTNDTIQGCTTTASKVSIMFHGDSE